MRNSITDIVNENACRLAIINTPYNPLVGTAYCAEIPRTLIEIPDAPIPKQYVPSEMLNEPIVQRLQEYKTIAATAKAMFGVVATKRDIVTLWRYLSKLRCQYDFEYWCATQIKIKLKGKGNRDYFILNRAQRHYLRYLEKLRKAGQPIDIILLKARQWGGSTMTQFYMLWIQTMHRKHWNSVICGDVEKQAKVVLAMLENAATDYDTFINDGEPLQIKSYGRSDSMRVIKGRDCTISVGSAQKPDKIRGEDITMAHLTEVGVWKSTISKTPEDLIESIVGSILPSPYSLLVLESTAKGVGNYFHDTWVAASKKENNFTPVFVPWFMIDNYSRTIPEGYEAFIATMSDYERTLFDYGATLEAISWYRMKAKAMNEEFRMKSEYPSTDIEAFQSTGRNYFKDEYLKDLYDSCTEPLMIGDVVSRNNILDKGKYLQDLRFEANECGKVKIWADVDTSVKMRDRYLVTVDLGKGASENADSTIACVFDRYWQQQGEEGYPEVVAEYVTKGAETDILAWQIAQLAVYYNNALLVIESNTIDSSREDRFRAVLDEIKDYYPNLYKRAIRNQNDVGNTGSFRYGWNTNHSSKEEICSDLNWAMREGMYVERCKEAVDEMKIFERHEDGTLGNVQGKNNHDDRVITRALGVHFCYSPKLMPLPTIYNPTAEHTYTKKIVGDMTL